MTEKSGSVPPPAFKRWNRITLETIRWNIIHCERCICCLKAYESRNRNKRNVCLDNAFGFHLAAYSLGRTDNNPWPNETVENNRFDTIKNFSVCKNCHRFCERRYNFSTFSAENSEKFAHLQKHITPQIQFGAAVSQQLADEIRINDSAEAEDFRGDDGAPGADVSFPNVDQPHIDSSPERPPSPIRHDDDEEQLQDAFFHFGMRDEGEDPDHESDSDSDYDPHENENIDPFAQQEAHLCPAQWNPHEQKNYDGFQQLLIRYGTDQCVVCHRAQENRDKTNLTTSVLWDLCEHALLQVMNSNSSHFICSDCLCENMTKSDYANERMYYHIVAQPPVAQVIKVKSMCKQKGPLILRRNVDAKEWHKLNEQKILERDREARLRNTNFQNFSFSSLTESAAIHLFGCKKSQLLHIFDDFVSRNLKDGSKFKKDNKFLIFMFYIRHHLAMRAMSSIMNISFMSISNILTEVESAIDGFIQENTAVPSHDELVTELTTEYCRFVHMREDPELQVIIADGGYSYLNAIGMSGSDSTENWSGHKHRPLRKYMTICSSTGHLLFSNTSWPGRLTDNDIMKRIFSGEVESANPLLELIRTNKTLLICDRGFDGFKSWIEQPEQVAKYPLLKVIIPVNTTDNNQRYSREDVNRSRKEVTAIRDMVERYHGAQKKFLILNNNLNLEFFNKHWLKIHMFVNAILNRFGRLNPIRPTFTDEERFVMINNNSMIIDTNLSDHIAQPGHDLEWKKRSTRVWKEFEYDDANLLGLFPTLNEKDLNSLNGGSYHLRKARGYEVQIIEYLKDRKRQLIDGGSIRSVSTVSTLNSSFAMKIQVLSSSHLSQYFGDQFTACLRLDVPSYFSKYRKFKTAILIRNVGGERPKFSFGCLCSTGLRTNPCTHAILVLYLYSHRFKYEGFPVFEQRLPV